MTIATFFSLLINIAVGIYFARYYPRQVERQFRGRRVPPFFAVLAAILRPIGYLLIIASAGYAVYIGITG
ncbi:hypothetical protein [Thiohalomonas denitrificans]|uniref:hypothetical protein n=1 Tax=Thiohalomonas denitrificans TaxID=415747 RepID=UPI0026EB8360|nr:hypothetical protein [Thiohalomonas denitrificans]